MKTTSITGYFLHDFFDMLIYDARKSSSLLLHHVVVSEMAISNCVDYGMYGWDYRWERGGSGREEGREGGRGGGRGEGREEGKQEREREGRREERGRK